jgi:hypothetical protein
MHVESIYVCDRCGARFDTFTEAVKHELNCMAQKGSTRDLYWVKLNKYGYQVSIRKCGFLPAGTPEQCMSVINIGGDVE